MLLIFHILAINKPKVHMILKLPLSIYKKYNSKVYLSLRWLLGLKLDGDLSLSLHREISPELPTVPDPTLSGRSGMFWGHF